MKNSYYHPDLTEFQRDRFGMFIHWGVYSMYGTNEWCKYWSKLPEELYQLMVDNFNPDMFEPREWAKLAKSAGMKYVIFTTKHHDGFCMWDSKYTDYKITNTPYKKDIVREVVEAFRAENIKVGLYYSITDWHHPHYMISQNSPQSYLPQEEQEHLNSLKDNRIYNQYMRNQVTELLTEYGEIVELWFDISFQQGAESYESEKMVELVRKLAPEVILNNRLDLEDSNDILTPEGYLRYGDCFDESGNSVPWEGCLTLGASWGYNRDELSYWRSPMEYLTALITNTSLNGNSLFNIGPTSRGYIDEHELESISLIVKWMKYNSKSIYGCGAAPEEFPSPKDCRYTYNSATKRLYLHVFNWARLIYLPNMAGKILYAQTLHDGCFVKVAENIEGTAGDINPRIPQGFAGLCLMSQPRNTDVPVIEIFLK